MRGWLTLFGLLGAASCGRESSKQVEFQPPTATGPEMTVVETGGPAKEQAVNLTEDEWRARLSPLAFHVLREKGTEVAFTGKLYRTHDKGLYRCAGCNTPLFSSGTKFESGTGWPSFTAPFAAENVHEEADYSFGMQRTEVACKRCGGHLGHVFPDGPAPTGLRYCINSVSLRFEPAPK